MRIVALVALCGSGILLAAPADAPAKKRIAVLDFDNAAVHGGVESPFFQTSAPNLGKASPTFWSRAW